MRLIKLLCILLLSLSISTFADTNITKNDLIGYEKQSDINLTKQMILSLSGDIKIIKKTITLWEDHIAIDTIDLFNKYVNGVTISLVFLFIAILFTLFGKDIFQLSRFIKLKKEEITTLSESQKSSYTENEIKYTNLIGEYKERIETLVENYETKLNTLEIISSQKIDASVRKADLEIRKYQDEVNKIIEQLNGDNTNSDTPNTNNNPF